MSPQSVLCGRRARLAVVATTLAALAFFGGTLLVPLGEAAGEGWARLLRSAYAPLCHQLAERSLSVGGGVQAVCARCAGLYLGGIAGLAAGAMWLAGSGRRPRPVWLVLAAAPTAVDALLPWLGLPGLDNVPRLIVSLPAGAAAGLFLALAVAELVSSEPAPRATRAVPPTPLLEEADG